MNNGKLLSGSVYIHNIHVYKTWKTIHCKSVKKKKKKKWTSTFTEESKSYRSGMTWWWVNETNSSKILSESDKTLVHSTHSVSCVYCGLLLDTSLNCCILVYIKTLSSARRLATHSLTAPCQDQTQSRLNAYTHSCRGHMHQILGSIVARQCEGQSGAWMGWDKASQTLSLMRWITRHAPLGIANHKTFCSVSTSIGCQGNKVIQVYWLTSTQQLSFANQQGVHLMFFTVDQDMPQGLLCGLDWI